MSEQIPDPPAQDEVQDDEATAPAGTVDVDLDEQQDDDEGADA